MIQIIHQPYVAYARGLLKAGISIACSSATEGSRRAEHALVGGSVLDALVVRMTYDDEFGGSESLGAFGLVPEPEE